MGKNNDKKIVLTEEVYTLCLSYIIERDFYSNLNQLQDKLSQICTELDMPFEQGDNLLNFLLNSEYKIDLNLNLDTFLSIYTSEDNQSYEKIVEKYELKRNELIKKLEQVNSKQLRIENKEPQDLLLIKDNEYKKVEGWKYKAQNSLMLLPDTKSLNTNNSQLVNTRAAPKKILYNNTRLDDVQTQLESVPHIDKQLAGEYVPPIHSSLGPGAVVGVDGKNYDFINSPANPPAKKPTHAYTVPETPKRDLLAYKLSKKSKLSSTSTKTATPRTLAMGASGVPLSPAGKRLLEQLGRKKKSSTPKTKYSGF